MPEPIDKTITQRLLKVRDAMRSMYKQTTELQGVHLISHTTLESWLEDVTRATADISQVESNVGKAYRLL